MTIRPAIALLLVLPLAPASAHWHHHAARGHQTVMAPLASPKPWGRAT